MSYDALLRHVYYDVEHGFGSIAETLRRAKALRPEIKYQDVKDFLDRQELRQGQKVKRYNSFVPPPWPLEQLQMDLADFGSTRRRGGAALIYRYGLVAVDIFTKRLALEPLRGKTADECAAALDVVLEKLGLPATVLTDQGGEFQAAFDRRLRYFDVEHVVTRTPPIFVERQIRTLKEGVERRLRALQFQQPWYAVVQAVVNKYNVTPQTTTKFAPNAAATGEHNQAVYRNIQRAGRFNRRYPDLHIGDTVKVVQKPGKYSELKAGFQHWSAETFRVHAIDQRAPAGPYFYKLDGRERPLLRHELLKVAGVERAPEGFGVAPPRRTLQRLRPLRGAHKDNAGLAVAAAPARGLSPPSQPSPAAPAAFRRLRPIRAL